MTPEERAILVIVITNFPLVVGMFLAFNRGWIVLGTTHRDQKAQDQKALEDEKARSKAELEFREALRQEGLADKKAVEDKSARQAESIKDLTDVVTQSLALNDRLVDESRFEVKSDARSERDRARDGTDRRAPSSSKRTRRRASLDDGVPPTR